MKFKLILFILLIGTFSFAQKKEKIKGNKFVKVKQHQIADFSGLTLNEDFEVFLLKGELPQIEIETDENLHEVILFAVSDKGILNLRSSHNITSKKKLNIRITVTKNFNSIILSDKAILNSLIDLELDKINISVFPNPNNGLVNIALGTLTDVKVKIYTVDGRVLYEENNISSLVNERLINLKN